MQTVTITCDRCRSKITPPEDGRVAKLVIVPRSVDEWDLCKACVQALKDFIIEGRKRAAGFMT